MESSSQRTRRNATGRRGVPDIVEKRDRQNHRRADLTVKYGPFKIAIEIGRGRKDQAQLVATIRDEKCSAGILISREEKIKHDPKNRILSVPLPAFLQL